MEKIVGLKLGADEYITKPFEMLELMARIEALLRRAPVGRRGAIHRFGSIHVDAVARTATRAGIPIHLSTREFQLLVYFIQHAGTILPRDKILNDVWEYEVGTQTRTVDMHVASLRQKLEEDPTQPALILTVTGVGYRFVGSVESSPTAI